MLRSKADGDGQQVEQFFVGQNALTRKGVIGILRSRVLKPVSISV